MAYAYDNEEFSRYYDTFVAEHVSNDTYYTDTVQGLYDEVIQRSFVANQCAVIVDLGCGTGDDLNHFKERFQKENIRLIGVDHSQAMLTRAKEKLNDQTNNSIDFIHSDLTNFTDCLPISPVDCILLPAGTFHHLITNTQRQQFISNLRQVLRPDTGLFLIYLMPDSFIRIDVTPSENSEDKFRLISSENLPQTDDDEWICKQTFELNVPPKIELSWQLRTCCIPKLVKNFRTNGLEIAFCSFNGKDLVLFHETLLPSLNSISTPVILVFRTIKHTIN
jgi:ubiquinone/menaquinone biosynthesis C-methylase UbiE